MVWLFSSFHGSFLWYVVSENSINPRSFRIPPVFFWVCYSLCVPFKSMIHLELILSCEVCVEPHFFPLYVSIQLAKPFAEAKNILSQLNYFCIFVKNQWLYLCGSISGFSILLHWYACLYFHWYMLYWLINHVYFWNWVMVTPPTCSSF